MSPRLVEAWHRFDEVNAQDPNYEVTEGKSWPRELLYARRLTDWVLRLKPDASEALCLAARCQHLGRWEIPRDSYPVTRSGYLGWRSALQKLHAEKSTRILHDLRYPEEIVRRVQAFNLKQNMDDPEMRVLEDALCLMFLQFQLRELVSKLSDEKVVNAVRKSWNKMTGHARVLALSLNLDDKTRALLRRTRAETDAQSGPNEAKRVL